MDEARSIRWIVKELNRLGAPKDHRATTPEWHHALVVGILSNEKYIGIWPWGQMRGVRDPFTGEVSQKPRPDEETEKWTRNLPHLQFIDDETFAAAQRRLEDNEQALATHRDSGGKLRGSPKGSENRHARHLLQGLIKCGECERNGRDTTLCIGGAHGQYLVCPRYARGTCSCRTGLRRDLAERMILDSIGEKILKNDDWFQAVLLSLRGSWEERSRRIPAELQALDQQIADIDRRISKLVDRIEEGDESPEISKRLAQRREERNQLARRRKKTERDSVSVIPEPTEEWLREKMARLGETLTGATPAAAAALRQLVGGRIVVEEIRIEGRKRHSFRGRFRISASTITDAVCSSPGAISVAPSGDPADDEIVIDFVEASLLDKQSERAMELYNRGMMCKQIAQDLGVSKSRVTAILHSAFESQGKKMPDGRNRRKHLEQKSSEPALFEKVSEEAKLLYDGGKLMTEIAEALKIDRNTATKAIRYWFESRGLPVPDGRSRLRELQQKRCG